METKTRQSGVQGESPVDDATYNLLQALTSKLEAIEAYEIYAQDDTDGVFQELLAEERNHAERLLEALRGRLSGG
jgi:rubrerythrin